MKYISHLIVLYWFQNLCFKEKPCQYYLNNISAQY